MKLLATLATVRRIARAVRTDDYKGLILGTPALPTDVGYVYLITNPEYAHKIKCGRSNDPARRARDYLQAVDAYPWEVMFAWEVSDMAAAEAAAHASLRGYNYGPQRRNGKPTETFKASVETARPMVEAAIQPWHPQLSFALGKRIR